MLNQIKPEKYQSIIIDSTLDIAYIDQLCFVICYILDDESPVIMYIIIIKNLKFNVIDGSQFSPVMYKKMK